MRLNLYSGVLGSQLKNLTLGSDFLLIGSRSTSKSIYFYQNARTLATKRLTPSLTFMTNAPGVKEIKLIKNEKDSKNGQVLKLDLKSEGRPLSVLVCWLMSKTNAVNKYAKLYLDQGFDVLTVRISPWQLLWPKSAAPIIENEILNYLVHSDHEKKILHGFSVGGYVFAQMLKNMEQDESKFKALRGSFKGQIWDSVCDIEGTAIGVSNSVFPNNSTFQISLQRAIEAYMYIMYPLATKYYYESHEYFYYHPLKAPALFFCSKSDQISSIEIVNKLQREWAKVNIPTRSRVWENTLHVSHYYKHPEEYTEALMNYMGGLDILPGTRANTYIEEVEEIVKQPQINRLDVEPIKANQMAN